MKNSVLCVIIVLLAISEESINGETDCTVLTVLFYVMQKIE